MIELHIVTKSHVNVLRLINFYNVNCLFFNSLYSVKIRNLLYDLKLSSKTSQFNFVFVQKVHILYVVYKMWNHIKLSGWASTETFETKKNDWVVKKFQMSLGESMYQIIPSLFSDKLSGVFFSTHPLWFDIWNKIKLLTNTSMKYSSRPVKKVLEFSLKDIAFVGYWKVDDCTQYMVYIYSVRGFIILCFFARKEFLSAVIVSIAKLILREMFWIDVVG